MARRKSNQRITKIKKDYILDLLQRAEATPIEDACSVQPAGSDLTPYPDLNNLRLWTRDHLLKGVTKLFPVSVDENGQTYYTCLIDGLPLHTKLTKQISEGYQGKAEFLNQIGNPTINIDGKVTGLDLNNHFNINQLSETSNSISLYIEVPETLNASYCLWIASDSNSTANTFEFRLESTGELKFLQNASYVNDVTAYVPNLLNKTIRLTLNYNKNDIGSYYINGSIFVDGISYSLTVFTPPSNISNPVVFTICYTAQVTNNFTLDLSKSNYNTQPLYFTTPGVETSKPGLWLSNLVAPISNSVAGSYLKHNFIHDYSGSFNTVNSDVIGNYSYSYFQRGIIHRTAGSTHDDNDSYCQHWSPSALSCISHDAIIIPLNNLRSTYTSYQTYVVPSDPNMQRYDETPSKDVEFYFVDNNNNEPLTTTEFNGRVVGDGWTYELVFEPNGNGSGNDYGEGDDPTVPNGSNGGCITGTISYQDSVLGTNCVQEVNSCFQTNQSYFNPLVPDIPSNSPLDQEGSTDLISIPFKCCIANPWGCMTSHYGDKSIPSNTKAFLTGGFEFDDNNLDHIVSSSYLSCPGGTQHCVCNVYLYSGIKGSYEQGSCFCASKEGVIHYYPNNEIPEENGVNIYINIIDLKKQSESEGVPWNDNACGNARFSFTFSTEPCEESYCTSLVIATNVDISSLGDISKLDHVELSNIT